MQKTKGRCLCVLVALAAVHVPVWPQGKLDAQTFKTFGGTYLSDSSKLTSPKVTVFAEALVLLNGSRALPVVVAWYGRDAPPEYHSALLSEVPGGQQLIFIVNENMSGYYITLLHWVKTVGQTAIHTSFESDKLMLLMDDIC